MQSILDEAEQLRLVVAEKDQADTENDFFFILFCVLLLFFFGDVKKKEN